MERIEKIIISSSKIYSPRELEVFFGKYKNLEELEEAEEFGENPAKIRKFQDFKSLKKDLYFSNLLERKDLKIILFEDVEYPQMLKEIIDFPPILFAKGDISLLGNDDLKIASVGSRKNTSYGKLAIKKILPELVRKGVSIVSGLAYGIDSLSHICALEENSNTIAVLGCGVDIVYPLSNRDLYLKIISKGCIISEFFPEQKPEKYFFPQRNRIISGISHGVLVVEATLKSGSLITARLALDQNRDVFAVPGGINMPQSEGTNYLIQNGAKLVSCAADIIEEFPFVIKKIEAEKEKEKEYGELQSLEKEIISSLKEGEKTFDNLLIDLNTTSQDLNYFITLLSLKGIIFSEGNKFSIIK